MADKHTEELLQRIHRLEKRMDEDIKRLEEAIKAPPISLGGYMSGRWPRRDGDSYPTVPADADSKTRDI